MSLLGFELGYSESFKKEVKNRKIVLLLTAEISEIPQICWVNSEVRRALWNRLVGQLQ